MSLASDSNFVTGKYTLICKDNYYDITYNVANATVSSFTAHSNQDMRFDIQNSNNGHIIVDIPKKLVNESPPWNPIGTTVTIDGKFLDARQGMGNSTDRIMDIILTDGHFELGLNTVGYPETMGLGKMNCSVTPEFGPITGMIIVLSVIGAVLISRKFNY